MSVHITKSTAVTIEIPEIGVTFTTSEAFAPFDSDTVRWAPRDGGGSTLAWLCLDDNGRDDYWEDRDSGIFKEFTGQDERDEFIAEMIAEHGTERVFIVERYEHSLVHYSPIGTVNYPDRRWDVAPACVYVVPEDVEGDKSDYAKAVLNEYSDWCNGSVFGVVVRAVDADGDEITDAAEECWGFIGHDYALETAKDAANNGGL